MSGNIIQLNEDLIKNNLKDLVRDSVEETLNALLDHEADELLRAGKYERREDRKGYRSGHYERNFGTTSGEVKLRVPKLTVFCQADFLIFVVGIPHRHRGKIPTFSGPCQEAGSTTASCRMRACSIR